MTSKGEFPITGPDIAVKRVNRCMSQNHTSTFAQQKLGTVALVKVSELYGNSEGLRLRRTMYEGGCFSDLDAIVLAD